MRPSGIYTQHQNQVITGSHNGLSPRCGTQISSEPVMTFCRLDTWEWINFCEICVKIQQHICNTTNVKMSPTIILFSFVFLWNLTAFVQIMAWYPKPITWANDVQCGEVYMRSLMDFRQIAFETRCWFENEDVVGVGAAPTTSEWSKI